MMQNVSATSRILGRKTSGSGDPEECTISEILDFVGSAANGDILRRVGGSWVRLAIGSNDQFLRSTGSLPQYAYIDHLSGIGNVWEYAEDTSTPASGGFSAEASTLFEDITECYIHTTSANSQNFSSILADIAANTHRLLIRYEYTRDWALWDITAKSVLSDVYHLTLSFVANAGVSATFSDSDRYYIQFLKVGDGNSGGGGGLSNPLEEDLATAGYDIKSATHGGSSTVNLNIYTGSISGSNNSGYLTFTSGYVSGDGNTSSGYVSMESGEVLSGAGTSGTVTIQSGNQAGTGNTGNVTINTGDSSNGTSGNLELSIGNGSTRGYINFDSVWKLTNESGGEVGRIAATATGAYINGKDATTTNMSGGMLYLSAGAGDGSGYPGGDLILKGGAGANGAAPGKVLLKRTDDTLSIDAQNSKCYASDGTTETFNWDGAPGGMEDVQVDSEEASHPTTAEFNTLLSKVREIVAALRLRKLLGEPA